MSTTPNKRRIAALEVLLSACAWALLYGAPGALFQAKTFDRTHVLLEGAAALPLLVLALRKGPDPAPEGAGKPRHALLAAIAVPVFLAAYAAGEAFCLANRVPYGGTAEELFPSGGYIWYALRTCATASLMEELGCRWIAFGGLRRRGFGFWPSVLVSTTLFSLLHLYTNPVMAVGCIPTALLYCLLYEVTGTPWYGVVAHAAHNLLALPCTAWTTSELESLLYGVPRSVSIPVLLAVTAAIALLCAGRKKLFYRRGANG